MPFIRCITGSETFREGSAALIVTLEPQNGFEVPGGKGIFISEAAKNRQHVTEQSRPSYLPASTTGVREQGCYWDGNFDVPEGAILRCYARRKIRQGSRPYIEEGVVFIRAREDAALQRLQLRRIDSSQSTNAAVIVEGRFDVISIRDAGAARVPIHALDLQLAKADKVRAVFARTEIAPAKRAPAQVRIETVRSHDGEEVKVASTRRSRAIKL